MLMCSETPSAPNLIASFTEPVNIFLFGAVDNEVLDEKCANIPTLVGLGNVLIIPLLIMILVKP